MKKKLPYITSMISICLAFLLLLLYFFWSFYPYEPIKFMGPIQILNNEVYGGEMITYQIRYCKNMDLPAIVNRSYIDTVIYSEPSFIANNPVGCKINTINSKIPNLSNGEFKISIIYKYQVNPIRSIYVKVESTKFRIKEATMSAIGR